MKNGLKIYPCENFNLSMPLEFKTACNAEKKYKRGSEKRRI